VTFTNFKKIEQDLVTVIIPCYNAENHIIDTLNSVIHQTYKNLEIIVVDDNSTDNTLNLLNSIKDDRLKIIINTKKGAASARNQGIKICKGKYVQFLDADDILSLNKIEIQVKSLETNPTSIAVCSTIHFFDGVNHLLKTPNSYEEKFLKFSSNPVEFFINLWGGFNNKGSMIQPNSWLTPKILIEKYGLWNEDLTLDDDGEFFARLGLNATEIIYTPNIFNYYRKFANKNSLSSKSDENALKSALASALSKKQLLLAKSKSIEAQQAVYRNLINIATSTYFRYPSIYKKAIKELPKISYPYKLKISGNKIVNYFSNIFGWKFTVIILTLLGKK